MDSCSYWLVVGFNSMVDSAPFSGVAVMSILSVVPEELWGEDKQVELVEFLLKYVPGERSRKYIMLEWCRLNGIGYTRDMSKSLQLDLFP